MDPDPHKKEKEISLKMLKPSTSLRHHLRLDMVTVNHVYTWFTAEIHGVHMQICAYTSVDDSNQEYIF